MYISHQKAYFPITDQQCLKVVLNIFLASRPPVMLTQECAKKSSSQEDRDAKVTYRVAQSNLRLYHISTTADIFFLPPYTSMVYPNFAHFPTF